jgi:hypothetical protein
MAVRLNNSSLPVFHVAPKSLWTSARELLGRTSIDTESPDFQSRYRLYGPSEEKIRSLFSPDVIGFFENTSGLCMEGFDEWFLIYQSYGLVLPDDVDSFVNLGLKAADLFQIKIPPRPGSFPIVAAENMESRHSG